MAMRHDLRDERPGRGQPIDHGCELVRAVDYVSTRPTRKLARPRLALNERSEEEHSPPLSARQPCLQPSAARGRGLDDDRGERDPGHDRVAHREGAAAGASLWPELRDDGPLF